MAKLNTSLLFYTFLTLLMIDALLEMSFIAATVSFLHNRAGGSFEIAYQGSTFSLHGEPAHLLVNQGHASNGAAGTALILIGFGGLFAFWFLRRDPQSSYARIFSSFWLGLAIVSVLFTFGCMVATLVVTAQHVGQTIDAGTASALNNVPYPVDWWTPENWFVAVLGLDLASESDRAVITTKYHVIMGWRWNLVPLFILGVMVAGTGLVELRRLKMMVGHDIMREGKERDVGAWSDDGVYTGVQTEAGYEMASPVSPMLPSVTRKPVPEQHVDDVADRV